MGALTSQIPPNYRPNGRQLIRHGLNVLISSPTQTYHDIVIFIHLLRELYSAPDRMRGLQCRNDAFQLTQQPETLESLRVSGGDEFCSVAVFPGT